MPSDTPVNVDCAVEFSERVSPFGAFANAFRLMPEGGQECFLDFCVYSAQENRAQVVARIRVHRSFVPVLISRLEREMTNLTADPVAKAPTLRTADGRIVFFKGPQGES